MTAKEIAETTLMYLGGHGQLRMMINARNFSYDSMGTLTFRFSGCRKSNAVSFALNGGDLYDVTFYKLTRAGRKEVARHTDMFFDDLQSLFEAETGLYLTLSPQIVAPRC